MFSMKSREIITDLCALWKLPARFVMWFFDVIIFVQMVTFVPEYKSIRLMMRTILINRLTIALIALSNNKTDAKLSAHCPFIYFELNASLRYSAYFNLLFPQNVNVSPIIPIDRPVQTEIIRCGYGSNVLTLLLFSFCSFCSFCCVHTLHWDRIWPIYIYTINTAQQYKWFYNTWNFWRYTMSSPLNVLLLHQQKKESLLFLECLRLFSLYDNAVIKQKNCLDNT